MCDGGVSVGGDVCDGKENRVDEGKKKKKERGIKIV